VENNNSFSSQERIGNFLSWEEKPPLFFGASAGKRKSMEK
jgi:hypothetical protein